MPLIVMMLKKEPPLLQFASNQMLNSKLKDHLGHIYYRDKLKKLFVELETHNIIRQFGSTITDESVYGTTFFEPSLLPVSHLGTNFTPLIEAFMVLKAFHFFHKSNGLIFQELIDQGFALINIDDVLFLAHTKTHVRFNRIITPNM